MLVVLLSFHTYYSSRRSSLVSIFVLVKLGDLGRLLTPSSDSGRKVSKSLK